MKNAVVEREWHDSRPNWTPEWRIVAVLVCEIQLGRVQRLAPRPAFERDPRDYETRNGQSISTGRDLEHDRCRGWSRPGPLGPLVFPPFLDTPRGPWNIDNHASTACKGLSGWCTTSWIVLRAFHGLRGKNCARKLERRRFFRPALSTNAVRKRSSKIKRQDFSADSC